jgi:hypothetical protein
VIEFLVVKNECVGNIDKYLCTVYGSAVINRSTVDGHCKKGDGFQNRKIRAP